LNLVAELATDLRASDLLEVCRRLEREAERVRAERWGPRTLDVDVLWIDGEEVTEPDLEVPHPRLRERRFVLAPLADLAPDLVTPEEIAQAVGEVSRLGRLDDLDDR
jgi:2-amino-4-hydroxy-6-hydroxymethyldihydropteridine diphosphokinase